MKRLAGGILIALAVLALAGIIATQARNSQASETPPSSTAPENAQALAQVQDADETDDKPELKANAQSGKPFIGVVIEDLSDDEAEELGIDGGAVVRNVLDDGPSDGVLQGGDVITSIGDEAVESSDDLVEIIRNAAPGDVLEIGILRDGESQTVSVTVGERAKQTFTFGPHKDFHFDGLDSILGQLKGMADKFVRAEVVVETDDGFKTIKAMSGTVKEEVPEGSDTFTLVAKDGTEATFTIDDETMVLIKQEGSLDGLNTTDTTYVLSVVENGTESVKAVVQGDFPRTFKHGEGKPRIFIAPNFRGGENNFRGLEELKKRLEGMKGRPFFFNGGEGSFNFDLNEFLDDLHFDMDNFDHEGDNDVRIDRIRTLSQ